MAKELDRVEGNKTPKEKEPEVSKEREIALHYFREGYKYLRSTETIARYDKNAEEVVVHAFNKIFKQQEPKTNKD